MNQKAALRLQERMNEISADEFVAYLRIKDQFGQVETVRERETLAAIRNRYNKKRSQAIWWYEHGFDIKVLVFVVVFVLGLIWWMV